MYSAIRAAVCSDASRMLLVGGGGRYVDQLVVRPPGEDHVEGDLVHPGILAPDRLRDLR
jgi:hypothetical protein